MTTLGKLSLGLQCASSSSSGHTRGKSAAFRRGVQREPLSPPLQRGFCFLPRPLPAWPCPVLARGRLPGLRLCTAPESEAGLPRSASFTNKSGEDASVHREGQRVRRCAVQPYRPALRAILALGPYGGSSPARVTMCNTKASVPLSVPTISRQCDRVPLTGLSLSRVLETPPLPATPPRCGNRWHHTRLDHSFFGCP
jgi:hypothetical protein